MAVHKDRRTGKEIYLVPEFCNLTGLTEEMRNNFNLMKEIAIITKPDPNKRLEETKGLI